MSQEQHSSTSFGVHSSSSAGCENITTGVSNTINLKTHIPAPPKSPTQNYPAVSNESNRKHILEFIESDFYKSKMQKTNQVSVEAEGSTVEQQEADIGADISKCFSGYHHVKWYVSNAKQAASYFIHCFGFQWIAYRGLETGSKAISGHVVKNGDVVFEFVSPIVVSSSDPIVNSQLNDIHNFIKIHGDGVKDVAFGVNNVPMVYANAIKNGAKEVRSPQKLGDHYGIVGCATVEVFDDVHHTLIDSSGYNGLFLPGYVFVTDSKSSEFYLNQLPKVKFLQIDHCVQNEDWNQLERACLMYSKIFGFHRFWSVDEKAVSTQYSALRSVVMASSNELVKMPINEPAEGLFKSQIEEFIEFNNGSGVQHIALLTDDIITCVKNLRSRGVLFIDIPAKYYDNLKRRLQQFNIKLNENLSELQKLGILVDFDENGYLLQLFTKPLSDRPTFFMEIIQRNKHNGFGAGNFKALFESIESEQKLRGTLEKSTHSTIKE